MGRPGHFIPNYNGACAISVDKILVIKNILEHLEKNICWYQKPYKFVAATKTTKNYRYEQS